MTAIEENSKAAEEVLYSEEEFFKKQWKTRILPLAITIISTTTIATLLFSLRSGFNLTTFIFTFGMSVFLIGFMIFSLYINQKPYRPFMDVTVIINDTNFTIKYYDEIFVDIHFGDYDGIEILKPYHQYLIKFLKKDQDQMIWLKHIIIDLKKQEEIVNLLKVVAERNNISINQKIDNLVDYDQSELEAERVKQFKLGVMKEEVEELKSNDLRIIVNRKSANNSRQMTLMMNLMSIMTVYVFLRFNFVGYAIEYMVVIGIVPQVFPAIMDSNKGRLKNTIKKVQFILALIVIIPIFIFIFVLMILRFNVYTSDIPGFNLFIIFIIMITGLQHFSIWYDDDHFNQVQYAFVGAGITKWVIGFLMFLFFEESISMLLCIGIIVGTIPCFLLAYYWIKPKPEENSNNNDK